MGRRTARLAPGFAGALVACCAAAGSARAQVPGRCEVPVAQRASEAGCYILAAVALGELPAVPLFWHLYAYPDRATAEAAAGPRATVVEAHGRIWLLAVAAQDWRPPGGERVAALGPFQARPGARYTAHYVEAVFPPGMRTVAHQHHGPEASYVVAGEECVETPAGRLVSRAGEGAVVPEGTPMVLVNPGPEMRRAVALILHDAAHPWSVPAPDWRPTGLCGG
jgi:quercetin dioxygenase-like cupin family protein